MQRRKLLIGLGSAAGVGGLIGSGAFSSVSADRDVTVSVAGDSSAFLALEPASTPNGDAYATTTSDDTLTLDFSYNGSGLGTDSVYEFDDVFRITNQGTQTIYVWSTFSGSSGNLGVGDASTDVWLYPNGDSSDKLRDNGDQVLGLPVGESALIGVRIGTDAVTSNQTLTMTLNADVEEPSGSSSVDDRGETFAVVDSGGSGDYGSIQDAIDGVSGSTIYVRSGTYDESITVDTSGLNVKGPNAGIAGDGGRGPEATITGQVEVTASDVVFDGFDVSPPPATSNQTGEALRISNAADGVTVANNVVRDFAENGVPEWEGVEGIVAFGGDSADAVQNVTIADNRVANVEGRDEKGGAAGIVVQGNVSGAVVRGNRVSGIGLQNTSYSFGVVVRGTGNHSVVPSAVEIRENDVDDVLANTTTPYEGVALECDADASAITATDNVVDKATVDLVAENKDTSNALDVTNNWWGDVAGPDRSQIADGRLVGGRGAITYSPFLDAPPADGGTPVHGGSFTAPGPHVFDFDGDGTLDTAVADPGSGAPSGAEVHITSGGTTTADYGSSSVRLDAPPTLGELTASSGQTTLTYDYYGGADNGKSVPDEVYLLIEDSNGRGHVVYRSSDDEAPSAETWKTRNVHKEIAGNPDNNEGFNWFEITSGGTSNLGNSGPTSDLSEVYGDDATVVAVAPGRGTTGGGDVLDAYYRDLSVGGTEVADFPTE